MLNGLEITAESLCQEHAVEEWVTSFQHTPNEEVVFGCGVLQSIGQRCRQLGGNRVLLVTDPGLINTGHPAHAAESIKAAGAEAFIFSEVHENPTTDDVSACVAFAQKHEIDFIVGLGGGSSLDTAKGCNFILTNGGSMQDYWGVDKATQPMLPFIAIPTTSGTGSECQSFALIADAETHAKMACGDKKAAATVTLLDPELTLTQPAKVTSLTGIDAICHALETAVCKKRNEISFAYSRAAWQLLNSGFELVIRKPNDLKARAQMQLGAAFAGIAIENSMLGIAHSCANPLTAHFDVVHGQAVGVMMPHVLEFNAQDSQTAEIYHSLDPRLKDRMLDLLKISGLKISLTRLNIDSKMIDTLAEEAAAQWTANFNPVSVTSSDLKQLYLSAY